MKIIIVGAGEVGYHIASRLALENKDVVVVDKNPEALRRFTDNVDVQVVQGSGSSPRVLEEAGIHEAEILLAVTDSDETNLVACLMTNLLSPTTKKLARIRQADFDKFHATFRENAPHIDTVINPEIEVVKTIDMLLSVPGAVEVGEFADGRVKFVGIQIDPDSRVAGVKLVNLREKTGPIRPLIAAVVRDEELIIPRGKDRLLAGDIVYLICEDSKLIETLAVFDKRAEPLRRAMIIGGGRIGFRLARLLQKRGVSTKIVEKSTEHCTRLAEELDGVVVLCGDGSDQNLLAEENIQDMDVVLTLTNDEETNILASLLSKRLGARKTITKVSKFSYFALMPAIGIELVVSPRLSAINTILQHIRRGKILSAIAIKGERAEVMEAVALETSDIVGTPLKGVPFPNGSLVIAIIREENVIIPSGESVIAPGDRIIIFAERTAIPKIEKILAVKLEYF
ncbi:MAG: Trk system potassium transporter TrkA [Desulfobacteraceae bacterium]|nr:Trk system potassium transporter TrkA [Desulfobacteraceae bacterium]